MAPGGTNLPSLRGDVDIPRLLRTIPATHAIKGVFVAPNAATVGADWPRVTATLRSPPRGGKYVAFTDYPLADHVLLSDLAARKLYPGKPTCEAHRLLARGTMDTFTQTTLGRIALAFTSGPTALLNKYGEVFNRLVTGPKAFVRSVDDVSAEVEYSGYYSLREAIYGVLEGIVLACDLTPTVTIEARGDGRYLAQVSWEP